MYFKCSATKSAFAGGTDPVHANEYHHLGRTTEFQYGMFLGDVLRGFTPLKNLWNFGNYK